MADVFFSELKKLKRDRMAFTGFLIITVLPVLLIVKGFLIDKGNIDAPEWTLQVKLLMSTLLPLVSSFEITHLIQNEYQNQTIKNTLTVPVKRRNFILGKAEVWFCWYAVSSLTAINISLFGLRLLYPESNTALIGELFSGLLIASLAVFAAYMPVMWIAIMQKGSFYPAMLCSIGFLLIQLAGSQVNEKTILPASFVPFTAVTLLNLSGISEMYLVICSVSVCASFILGVVLSVICFSKQEF